MITLQVLRTRSDAPMDLDLHEVLDVALMDTSATHIPSTPGNRTPVPLDHTALHPSGPRDLNRLDKNLNRWDLISVGAFRRTHESGEVAPGYESAMKASPLSPMLYHAKPATSINSNAHSNFLNALANSSSHAGPSTDVLMHRTIPQRDQEKHKHLHKERERQERKAMRRALKKSRHRDTHPRHQHHVHVHAPNAKKRASRAIQRVGSYASPNTSTSHLRL